jgi:hypothetical protein
MENKQIQEKLNSVLAELNSLGKVKMPYYAANKVVEAINELELAIKFLQIPPN